MDICVNVQKTEEAADAVSGTDSFGKFDSLQALLEAYVNLEREFTKKCQRLAQLESGSKEEKTKDEAAEKTDEAAKEEPKSNECEKCACAHTRDERAKTQIEELAPAGTGLDDSTVMEYIAGKDNIREKIIAEYLYTLAAADGIKVLSGKIGSTPLTPPERPKTLREAKILADRLMKY